MDGTTETLKKRWRQRAEAAFQRMFEGKSQEELVTLTEREDMAVLIGRELAAFLLEEHVVERHSGAAGGSVRRHVARSADNRESWRLRQGEKLVDRTVTTRAGDIRMRRQRWHCAKCRIIFFSTGRATASGNGRLQPKGAFHGSSPVEQGVVVRRGK